MSNAVAKVEDAQESSVKDLDEIREETFALKSKMNDLSTSLNDAASVPGSSTNQDQSSVSVRTISRPDTLVRNKRKALKLSTKLITSVLATEFFDNNQETASLAMSNINQETCMVLTELRSRIPPKTSYNLIGNELKTEYALILEKCCKAFNVHLDKCKNLWITRDPLGGSSSAPDGDIRSARTSSPVPSPAGPSTTSSNFSTLATSPNSLTRSSTASSIDRMMSRSSLTRADTDWR
ncbi:hypothetical protein BJV82DRAFT_584491 [Fennellomyces sp. T-0311]|nr:hypothetical protein BJV82DRAFT_584491 [Fennellomyces sp. T-0311]